MATSIDVVRQIYREGFAIIERGLSEHELQMLSESCDAAFGRSPVESASTRTSQNSVYAARNVVELIPACKTVWYSGKLHEVLRLVLGDEFGLVRALFFDKPPNRTWALPWHKDLAIAVKDNSLGSSRFTRPTTKAGVGHVIAPADVLREMLTLRVHIDAAKAENGALRVIPGSHETEQESIGGHRESEVLIEANPGDVLAMRPMLTHASSSSLAGTQLHRRILHLEFSASEVLADGFQWHRFIKNEVA